MFVQTYLLSWGMCQLVLEVIDLIPNPIFSDVALRVGILGHWVNAPAMHAYMSSCVHVQRHGHGHIEQCGH